MIDKQAKQAKDTAKKIYLKVYKQHRKMDFRTAISVSQTVIDGILETVPKKIFNGGLLGDTPNPTYDFWVNVKNELQKTEEEL